MADATVKLRVLLESAGIKPTEQQLSNLNKKLVDSAGGFSKVNNAANKTKRNLEGVAQRAGSTGKDFSRMSQGMGGLVQAYATVAANVFALSSAFLVLRRTADLSSMIKSAEDFSNRFGVSVTRITKQMQAASGGALSFADALPTINKAVSAGIGTEKLEELTVAATKASQTFGGSAAEALNRFISASQRGRVEIIQTLGIVIKTEQAYKDYGASIGKTALELSAFDRQQAILNATIEESKNVFDGVNIDPNPFQQLLTTMIDLKDVVGTFITDSLTPMFNAFNQSKAAAAAFIALILKSVTSRIFPAISEQLVLMQKNSFESTREATRIMEQARNKQTKIILETGVKQNNLTKDQLIKRSRLFDTYYTGTLIKHKSFKKDILTESGKVNAAILNERRSAITRELNLRAKGGGSEQFKGASSGVLENERNRLILLTKETNNARAAIQKLTAAEQARNSVFRRGAASFTSFTTSIRANTIALKAQLGTGFQRVFAQTQESFILGTKRMAASWSLFTKLVITQSKGASLAVAAFTRAIGASAGFIAGILTKAFGAFLSITVAISAGIFIWEKYGDSIRGITPGMRTIIDAGKEFDEALEEVNIRTSEGIVLLGENMPTSLKKLGDAFKFVAGTIGSVNTAIINLRKANIQALGGLSIKQAREELISLERQIKDIKNKGVTRDVSFGGTPILETVNTKEQQREIKALEDAIKNLEGTVEQFANTSQDRLIEAFTQSVDLAKKTGFTDIERLLDIQIKKVGDLGKLAGAGNLEGSLFNAFKMNDANLIISNLDSIEAKFGKNKAGFAEFVDSLLDIVSGYNSSVIELSSSTDKSISSLAEVNNRISTYAGTLDKLRSASGPNKEINAFILDINRELTNLVDLKEKGGANKLLSEIFGDPKELEQVKALLGFSKDAVVDVVTAQRRSAEAQEILKNQTLARLVGGEKLKTLSIALATINERQIRSDADLLTQVIARKDIEAQIAKQKLDNLNADVSAQEEVILIAKDRLGASEQELSIENEKLETLKAQAREAKINLQNIEDSLVVEEKSLEIRQKILESQLKVNAITKSINSINLKFSKNDAEHLVFIKEQYRLNKSTLKIEEDILGARIQGLKLRQLEGPMAQRELNEAVAELDLLKAKTRELERQNLLIQAREVEQSSERFFSEESFQVLGAAFGRELRDQVRDLAPFLISLGQGFANTINAGVDAAIDKLFEGHGFSGFKDAVIEALKTGLRETFAEAFKNEIKKGIFAIFDITTAEQKAQQRHTEVITANNNLIAALNNNTAAQGGGTTGAAMGTPAAVVNQVLPGLGALGSLPPFMAGADDKSPKILDGLKKEQGVTTESISTADKNAMNTGQGIMGILWTMISTLITGFASMVTSNLGGIFASGGIAKGGLSKITPMAMGGVTRGPNLALIGEGKNDEAVVPLPNNREIPVNLNGAGGDTIQIEQNFDFRNADTSAIPILRQEARAIEERTFNRVFSEINKGGRYARLVGRR